MNKMSSGLSRVEWCLLGAVLVIALGVAFPLYLKQQKDRNRMVSGNNLRQWGIAFNLYLADSDNALPRAGNSETVATQDNAWFNALPPYLSQPMLKDLTEKQRPRPGQPSLWINPAAKGPLVSPPQWCFHYGMNPWLSSPNKDLYFIYEIENPMAVVFLAEIESSEPLATPESVSSRHLHAPTQSPQAATHFLFCDGHVELLRRAIFTTDPQALDLTAPSERFTWIPFINAPAP
jgi:prepilin-type processing-associated H-X9-DG protein